MENKSEYFWRVKSINVGGGSDWSDIFSFETIIGSPSITTLTTPENGSTITTLLPEFNWVSVDLADNYNYELATDSEFANILLDSTLRGTSFIPVEKLQNGTEYFWRVRA